MSKKRIGILTGGGDCPGLNAVIRAAVRTLIEGGHEVLKFVDPEGQMVRTAREVGISFGDGK